MLTSINDGIADTNVVHPQTHVVQSHLVSLLPLTVFESSTCTAVVVANIRDIFWDAFVEQIRSDGRDIGSVQLKNLEGSGGEGSRGEGRTGMGSGGGGSGGD